MRHVSQKGSEVYANTEMARVTWPVFLPLSLCEHGGGAQIIHNHLLHTSCASN